jgi:hypothetical protein
MAFFEEVVLKDSIEIKTTKSSLRVKEAHMKTGWKTTGNNYANVIIVCASCWSISA